MRSSVSAKWCGVTSQVTWSPCFARGADGVESLFRGEVRDVEVRVRDLAHEGDVALDEAGFGFDGHAAQAETEREGSGIHRAAAGEARVFGVLNDGKPGRAAARRASSMMASPRMGRPSSVTAMAPASLRAA